MVDRHVERRTYRNRDEFTVGRQNIEGAHRRTLSVV